MRGSGRTTWRGRIIGAMLFATIGSFQLLIISGILPKTFPNATWHVPPVGSLEWWIRAGVGLVFLWAGLFIILSALIPVGSPNAKWQQQLLFLIMFVLFLVPIHLVLFVPPDEAESSWAFIPWEPLRVWGNRLVLLMGIALFDLFALVLAGKTWQTWRDTHDEKRRNKRRQP